MKENNLPINFELKNLTLSRGQIFLPKHPNSKLLQHRKVLCVTKWNKWQITINGIL